MTQATQIRYLSVSEISAMVKTYIAEGNVLSSEMDEMHVEICKKLKIHNKLLKEWTVDYNKCYGVERYSEAVQQRNIEKHTLIIKELENVLETIVEAIF